MFFEISGLKNFALFTKKCLCWSLLLIKGLELYQKETSTQVFSLDIAKFLRKAFFTEHFWWLLLNYQSLKRYSITILIHFSITQWSLKFKSSRKMRFPNQMKENCGYLRWYSCYGTEQWERMDQWERVHIARIKTLWTRPWFWLIVVICL